MEDLSTEILFKILLDSDYKDLTSYCLGNTNIYNICQDEYFWKQKLDKDYPGLRMYKPTNLTYQQQYISLYNLPPIKVAIGNNRLDQLMALSAEGRMPNPVLLTSASLTVLNYYANNYNVLPDPEAYYYAAVNNNFDILEWLYQKDIEIPGELEVNGVTYGLTGAIIKTMGFAGLPILLWLDNHGRPMDEWTANEAAFLGNIQLLEWLETNRNILPDVYGANLVVGEGNIQILDWLAERGIYPDEEGIREATKVETLIWLSKYYEPTAGWALTAIHNGNTRVVSNAGYRL